MIPQGNKYTQFLTSLNQLDQEIETKLSSTESPNLAQSDLNSHDYSEFLTDLAETISKKTKEEKITVPEVEFTEVKTKGILRKTDSTTSTGKSRRSIIINTAKNQLKEYEPEYRKLYFKEKDRYVPKVPEFYENKEDQVGKKKTNLSGKNDSETNQIKSEKESETIENQNSQNLLLSKEKFSKFLDILDMQIKILTDKNQKKKAVSNFIDEIGALKVLKQGIMQLPNETIENLDLILYWILMRVQEINPFFIYQTLDYLHLLFNYLIKNDFKITDYQGELIVPCLIENFSDSRPYIQPAISILIRQLSICYDDRKIFKHLMWHVKSSNDTIRVECLDEICFLLSTFYMESYEPEKNLNELASLIEDTNKTIVSSAMTIIAVCFIKYGNDAFDYINNYDYIPMIKRHLNANYDHINDLARQKISIDSQIPLVFKYIKDKCNLIDDNIQDFGKKDKIKDYVNMVNDRTVENCVNALLNLGIFLVDEKKFIFLEDYVDDLMKNCSIALNKALIEYSTNKDLLILSDLIQTIFRTVSNLFIKGLGKLVNVDNLKMFMFSLVISKKIMSRKDEKLAKTDTVFKNLVLYSDETSCLISLFRVLNDSLKKENSMLEFSNYVVNVILFRLKGIEFSKIDAKMDEKLEKLNKDFIKNLDTSLVLIEIHKFLEKNPTLNTDLSAGMIGTAVNSLLQDLVIFYGPEIFDFLDEKIVSRKSQLRKKIDHNINQLNK